jgi:hypothetical protein
MLFDVSIALRLRHDLSKITEPTPRSGACETWVTPGSPPTRLTAVPNKWIRPTRRLADLLVGLSDLTCGPGDEKTAWCTRQGSPDGLRQLR